jgi:hypothetical protein
MPEINKTGYTKFVDASVTAFTAQCRGSGIWEVQFGSEQPAANTDGILVPAGLPHAITRANAEGHGWAKVYDRALNTTAFVVVVS